VFLVQKSLTRARAESPLERLIGIRSLVQVPDLLRGEGVGPLRRIGLEFDVLPAAYYLRFQELFPGVELVDASDAIRKTRMIKSPYELEQIRAAAGQLERSFDEIPGWMAPGLTELELQARLEGHLRSLGHGGMTRMRAFKTEIAYGTVSSGPSAAYP